MHKCLEYPAEMPFSLILLFVAIKNIPLYIFFHTSSQLSMLRKFKFSLSRHNLETIYFTYILPLLEYACELWDGCTQQEYNKIEQIQHEAARIITGLPKFCSLESVYFEIGWEPLHSRQRRRKLNMFYKIRNNNAPSYLCDCLLPFERNENAYNLHNQTDYSNPFTRLQLYHNSFFPSSIKLWNNLPLEIRSAPTVSSFKKSLINDVNLLKPSRYYSYGCRVLNVLHTRLSHTSNNLNAVLYRLKLILTSRPSFALKTSEQFIDGIISFAHASVNMTDFSIGSINCLRHCPQT